MRRTIQSNKALYRDLAMESLAVMAWGERRGDDAYCDENFSEHTVTEEKHMQVDRVLWNEIISQKKGKQTDRSNCEWGPKNKMLNIIHWLKEEMYSRCGINKSGRSRHTRPQISVMLDAIIVMTSCRDAYLRLAVREDQLVIDCHRFPLRQRLDQQLLFHLGGTRTG